MRVQFQYLSSLFPSPAPLSSHVTLQQSLVGIIKGFEPHFWCQRS